MTVITILTLLCLISVIIVQAYLTNLNRRRHDALVELMWLLRDHESSARGTSIQHHAEQLRLTAEEILDEYRVNIVTLPHEDYPL